MTEILTRYVGESVLMGEIHMSQSFLEYHLVKFVLLGCGLSTNRTQRLFTSCTFDWIRKLTPVFFAEVCTGKSFSEALILASTNPQYDKSLSIELRVQ